MAMTEHNELNVHAFVMAERIIRETNGMYGAIGLFSSITVSDQQDDGCELTDSVYRITSPKDRAYNCVAWAAGDSVRWWEPGASGHIVDGVSYYWPPLAQCGPEIECLIDEPFAELPR